MKTKELITPPYTPDDPLKYYWEHIVKQWEVVTKLLKKRKMDDPKVVLAVQKYNRIVDEWNKHNPEG